MEEFKIQIDQKQLTELFNNALAGIIEKSISNQKEQIEGTIKTYFDKGYFKDKSTQFDNALDWAVECAFRDGLNKAMEELNYKELIAEKAKEILSDGNLINELAEEKIRTSLGLPKK